ncbi:MAG: hypothetical protein IKV58_02345 [Oscillospiraceae bacterium]|nr:hypothetical protein [Oscillospiraceae bacterium]
MKNLYKNDILVDLKKGVNIEIERVNQKAKADLNTMICENEKFYKDQLDKIAEHIMSNKDKIKMVLLAGPSGSGKTTTSNKLCDLLGKYGIKAFTISLDDFFKNRENLPVLPNGKPDYESLATLDVDEITRCFGEILSSGESDLPMFDFVAGKRTQNRKNVSVKNGEIIFVEGIHALNPVLTPDAYRDNILKLYISTKSQFTNKGKTVMGSTDLRLVRRMIRDFKFRGASAHDTLYMWPEVCEGENKYIKPFRDSADAWINSVHDYEVLVYKEILVSMLDNMDTFSEYYDDMQSVISMLGAFGQIDHNLVPEDSLLREFLG